MTKLEDQVFTVLWVVVQRHRLEAVTEAGTRYAVTGDIVREMARAAVQVLKSGAN